MNKTFVVAGKEIREPLSNRTILIMSILFPVVFGLSGGAVGGQGNTASLDGSIFFLSITVSVFMAYSSTAQIFLMEKSIGVIETLMCTPVTLRQIWLGKTLAATVPSYLSGVLAAVLVVASQSVATGSLRLPGAIIIAHVFIVVPSLVAPFIGLVGFGQLLLGMRENRLLNLILFIPVFAALYASGYALGGRLTISWVYPAAIFAGSVVLMGITFLLSRYLSKERITTTIG